MSQDNWICLLCKSSIKNQHNTLDDGITPCPNGSNIKAIAQLHLPKSFNEKTNFIKAFYVELKSLHVIPPDDISALSAAEYAYQQAKYTVKEAAALYADFISK